MTGATLTKHSRRAARRAQHGATLVIGLIMMVLITLVVISAFTLSSSNLKSVGNMQVREEGLAAANRALEQVISSNFVGTTAAQDLSVDIDKDGNPDYTVHVLAPACVKAVQASAGTPSDVELGAGMSAGATYYTDWELTAQVTDPASGASVEVREGIKTLISQAQKSLSCP